MEYYSGEFEMKGQSKTCVLTTLSSTKSKQRDVQKVSRKTSDLGSPRRIEWLQMGSAFILTTKRKN